MGHEWPLHCLAAPLVAQEQVEEVELAVWAEAFLAAEVVQLWLAANQREVAWIWSALRPLLSLGAQAAEVEQQEQQTWLAAKVAWKCLVLRHLVSVLAQVAVALLLPVLTAKVKSCSSLV